MVVKIGNKLQGETADEQLRQERRRFAARQTSHKPTVSEELAAKSLKATGEEFDNSQKKLVVDEL